MKTLVVVALLFSSFAALAQDDTYIEVVLDGKPALLNTKTGHFKSMNKKELVDYSKSNSKRVNSNATNGNTHTVNRGETLYSISKKYGVSMDQLKSVNKMENNALSVGQELNISFATAEATQVISENVWIVKKGDTLYSVSKQTGVSISDIKNVNNLESNVLSIGQSLNLK